MWKSEGVKIWLTGPNYTTHEHYTCAEHWIFGIVCAFMWFHACGYAPWSRLVIPKPPCPRIHVFTHAVRLLEAGFSHRSPLCAYTWFTHAVYALFKRLSHRKASLSAYPLFTHVIYGNRTLQAGLVIAKPPSAHTRDLRMQFIMPTAPLKQAVIAASLSAHTRDSRMRVMLTAPLKQAVIAAPLSAHAVYANRTLEAGCHRSFPLRILVIHACGLC